MLAAGEGNAGDDAELFSDDRSEEFAEVTLPGGSFLDQVIVCRLPTRETRSSRATNVAMATSVATNARISRVRGRAHFILLISTGPRTPRSFLLLTRCHHLADILFTCSIWIVCLRAQRQFRASYDGLDLSLA